MYCIPIYYYLVHDNLRRCHTPTPYMRLYLINVDTENLFLVTERIDLLLSLNVRTLYALKRWVYFDIYFFKQYCNSVQYHKLKNIHIFLKY